MLGYICKNSYHPHLVLLNVVIKLSTVYVYIVEGTDSYMLQDLTRFVWLWMDVIHLWIIICGLYLRGVSSMEIQYFLPCKLKYELFFLSLEEVHTSRASFLQTLLGLQSRNTSHVGLYFNFNKFLFAAL